MIIYFNAYGAGVGAGDNCTETRTPGGNVYLIIIHTYIYMYGYLYTYIHSIARRIDVVS